MIRSTAFKGGLKSSLPIVAGYLPVSFAFGVAAESVQTGTLAAVFTSLFILREPASLLWLVYSKMEFPYLLQR